MRQTHLEDRQDGSAPDAEPLAENRMRGGFTASDIVRIAACAENRVADFYDAAADRFASIPLRRLCLVLARQNRRHARCWSRTQAGLALTEPRMTSGTPSGGRAFQPESMVSLTWLGENRGPRDMLTGREDAHQILRDACRRIRDLTIFYAGLAGFASSRTSLAMIDLIVRRARNQHAGMEERVCILAERGAASTAASRTAAAVMLN